MTCSHAGRLPCSAPALVSELLPSPVDLPLHRPDRARDLVPVLCQQLDAGRIDKTEDLDDSLKSLDLVKESSPEFRIMCDDCTDDRPLGRRDGERSEASTPARLVIRVPNGG